MATCPSGKGFDPAAVPPGSFNADTTARLEKAPWYHSGPSGILKDGVQYVHRGRARATGRILMLLLAGCALAALTAGKYLDSKDLQGATRTVRVIDQKSITEQSPVDGSCPCKEQHVQWSKIVALKPEVEALVTKDASAYNVAQCNIILLERSTAFATPQQAYRESSAYFLDNLGSGMLLTNSEATSRIFNDYILYAVRQMCTDMLLTFQNALEESSGTETLFGSSLRTRYELEGSWKAYTYSSARAQMKNWESTYIAQTNVFRSMNMYFNQSCATPNPYVSCNQLTPIPELKQLAAQLGGSRSSMEPYMQVLRAAESVAYRTRSAIIGSSDRGTSSTKRVHQLVADYMTKAVDFKWTSYRGKCQPQYCDFVLPKTTFNRISELLSTVGGLWTVVLSATTLLWAGLGLLSCSREAGSAYFVWHC